MKKKSIQYTLRSVSDEVDAQLRKRSVREGESLNPYIISTLKGGVGLSGQNPKHHDHQFLIGTWVEDPKCSNALKAFGQIDEGLWK